LAPTKVVSVAVKFGELKIEGPWSARVQMPEVMHAERASRPEFSSSVTSEPGDGTQSNHHCSIPCACMDAPRKGLEHLTNDSHVSLERIKLLWSSGKLTASMRLLVDANRLGRGWEYQNRICPCQMTIRKPLELKRPLCCMYHLAT
jgi:hypothetical protein